MTARRMSHASPRALHRALLSWFDRERRPLPWRATTDPYAIWVSEVMLQQTQVDRVVPYWTRFIERFPSVEALAAASSADVLSAWRGLGYYSRARNLHRAAQVLVEQHAGALPASFEALRTLPGFGRYTAGAVASIAFGLRAPLVDGNVARVLSRLLEIGGAPGDRAREAKLWTEAERLLPSERPGDWNQALMELGATVCLPRNPLCLLCPVRSECLALAHDRVDELPPPKKAPKRKRLDFAVAVARRGDEVLLARREEAGLFGGLWEMPMAPCNPDGGGETALRALVGRRATVGPELSRLERTLTHRDLVLHLYPVELPARLRAAPDGYLEWRWVPREEVPALGMSSAMERALEEAAPPRVTRAGRRGGAGPRAPAR
jgi:A/G-specific adenine glycosylase